MPCTMIAKQKEGKTTYFRMEKKVNSKYRFMQLESSDLKMIKLVMKMD